MERKMTEEEILESVELTVGCGVSGLIVEFVNGLLGEYKVNIMEVIEPYYTVKEVLEGLNDVDEAIRLRDLTDKFGYEELVWIETLPYDNPEELCDILDKNNIKFDFIELNNDNLFQ